MVELLDLGHRGRSLEGIQQPQMFVRIDRTVCGKSKSLLCKKYSL